MRKKKKTANQIAWQKEVNRINRTRRYAEKKGYIFDGQIAPVKPSRITQKALKQIREIRGFELYARGRYFSPTTGQEFSGSAGYKIEKAAAQQKRKLTIELKKAAQSETPQQAYVIISNIKSELQNWRPSPSWSDYWTGIKRQDKNILEKIFYNAMSKYGLQTFAKNLQAQEYKTGRIIEMVQSVIYGSNVETTKTNTVELARIFNQQPLSLVELTELTAMAELDQL